MSDSPPTIAPPPRSTAVAIVGTDLVLAAFPATPVQIAHALHRLGFDVVVPASWGDELLAAATLARLEERGGVPAVYCACPRVAERLLATGGELAPVLLPLVSPPVAAARYVRAAYEGSQVAVTFLGGCCGATDDSIDARITPREFLRTLHERDIVLGELPRVFESVIPPDRRRHLSLPGGLPEPAQLASLGVPRELACLTSAEYAAELAQLVIAREPVLIDVAARLGCACVGATSSTPYERAHETVTRLEPPRAAHPVVDASLAGPLDATLPEPPARPEPAPEPAAPHAPRGGLRTPTPPRAMPASGGSSGPRAVQHTPPSQSRYPTGEPATGAGSRRRGGVTGFFRGVGSGEAPPRARTGEGMALPRAYVAKRRPAGDGARSSGEREAAEARARDERELPIRRHVEPPATPTPQAMPAFVAPPAVSPNVAHASDVADAPTTPAARATAAVARAIATPPAAEVPLPRAPEVRGNGKGGANGGARHLPAPEQPTRATVPPARRATPAVAPIIAPIAMPATPEARAASPDAPAERAEAPAVAPATAPTPRALPTLPAVGSGRELVFFVVGALLAGLAFALFR